MFVYYNANPNGRKLVGDCVVRAIAKATDKTWERVYVDLSRLGLEMADMPSSNAVWSELLKVYGFEMFVIRDTCPNCYTIDDFCRDNPSGTYVLGTGNHAVAVIDGCFFDTWNSGDEVPIYAFRKETNK